MVRIKSEIVLIWWSLCAVLLSLPYHYYCYHYYYYCNVFRVKFFPNDSINFIFIICLFVLYYFVWFCFVVFLVFFLIFSSYIYIYFEFGCLSLIVLPARFGRTMYIENSIIEIHTYTTFKKTTPLNLKVVGIVVQGLLKMLSIYTTGSSSERGFYVLEMVRNPCHYR